MTEQVDIGGIPVDRLAFDRAVSALKAGRAVVFPTDTVYGLGVAVKYASSPQEIFDLKRRDAGKPVAWLVGGVGDLDRFGFAVPEGARELATQQWPGALTLVVRASSEVPPAFRAPDGTIALRMPDSPVALALIAEVGPLATSSANPSGRPPVAEANALDPALTSQVAAILGIDAIPSSGTPSTIIDFSRDAPKALR